MACEYVISTNPFCVYIALLMGTKIKKNKKIDTYTSTVADQATEQGRRTIKNEGKKTLQNDKIITNMNDLNESADCYFDFF